MRILRNRIIISLFFIFSFTYFWEFWIKPETGPLYTEAVAQYRNGDYHRSLQLLRAAYQIDPNDTAILTLIGWDFLKTGNASKALPYFGRALRLNPSLEDARLGLAHSWLELENAPKALAAFQQLSPADRNSIGVRSALARVYRLLGDNQTALQIAEGVLREDKTNKLAAKELAYLTGSENLQSVEASRLIPLRRSPNLIVAARLHNGTFEVPQEEGWKPIYLAGVDIGPATPGHFASEPPTDVNVYLDWLGRIGGMGANCIRVYTLLPPAFYRALLTYNLQHSQTPLYLFQEIWLKDPPNDNLFDPTFTKEFDRDIDDVVDVVHGRADLPILKGRAGGIFSADVSPYVIGWLIGRELEPHIVISTNIRNPGVKSFAGEYLKIDDGNPTEVWLTERCNATIDYEVKKYNWQRPVAFVNWPPLDPLFHPTESGFIDELRMRRARGEQIPPITLSIQDDNDAVSLDEEKISPQPALESGYFALYHLYPFYPDFIFLDPGYRRAKDRQGLNSYYGYLEDLKKHFSKTPLVVGEYGLSTSIGIAHFDPNGWNHGGLDETQQGEDLVRLTNDIKDAGFAGGMVFEWIDEWWKHNWIAEDFEKPFPRKALWHNDLDPEQFFGLMKFLPTNPLPFKQVESPSGPATSSAATGPLSLRSIQWSADPSALYLDLDLNIPSGAEPDWSIDRYEVAINTCDARCGSSELPFVKGVRVAFGANFVVNLSGQDSSRLMVANDYNPYHRTPVEGLVPQITEIKIPPNLKATYDPHGDFGEMIVETNRRRIGRDGTYFPSQEYSRSLLRYGVFDPSAKDYNSLGQWYFDKPTGRIRLRLSWGLLLVLDPSEGLVYYGTDSKGKTIGKLAHSIHVAVVTYTQPGGAAGSNPTQIVARSVVDGNIIEGWSIGWPTWSAVQVEEAPKQSYRILAGAFSQLTGYRTRQPTSQ